MLCKVDWKHGIKGFTFVTFSRRTKETKSLIDSYNVKINIIRRCMHTHICEHAIAW